MDLVGLEDVSHLVVVLGVEHDQVAEISMINNDFILNIICVNTGLRFSVKSNQHLPEEDFVNFGLSQPLMLDKRDSDVTSIDTVLFPNVCQHFDNQILF